WMMERPCFSSSFAREKTARAPSPFSCETRVAIRLVPMGSSLSFWAGRWSDGNPEPINEPRKHFERGRSEEQLDNLGLRKDRAHLEKEAIVHGRATQVQLVGKTKPDLFLWRIRAIFEIADARDLFFCRSFLTCGNAVRPNGILTRATLRNTHRD